MYFNKVLPRTKQDKLLAIAELWPRNTPSQLLAYLVSKTDWRIFISEEHKRCIEDILVLWINHQRLNRCLRYFEDKNENALTKELRNLPHENWSPSKHLEWLYLSSKETLLSVTFKTKKHTAWLTLLMVKTPSCSWTWVKAWTFRATHSKLFGRSLI